MGTIKSDCTVGVVACGYECDDLIDRVLEPWKKFSKENIIFSGVYAPFIEWYKLFGGSLGETPSWYEHHKEMFKYFSVPSKAGTEAEIRNIALEPLLKKEECDYIFLLDLSDEIYTIEEIERIFSFVKFHPEISWFSLRFKNYVFKETQWLEGFNPPRVFSTRADGLVLKDFYFDNDIRYIDPYRQEIVDYKTLPSLLVPKNIAFIKHLTWLNNERSRRKYEYQIRHFGHCSYKWNYDTQELEFDDEYFLKYNLSKPKINLD
jgi:hypothetical protein